MVGDQMAKTKLNDNVPKLPTQMSVETLERHCYDLLVGMKEDGDQVKKFSASKRETKEKALPCVVTASVMSLVGHGEPKPTFLGIAILIAAAVFMPLLAREKRRLSAATGSAALGADAVQSALCAYLSLIALMGLVINAIWRIKWADPIAALAVLPLILREGWDALCGKTCDC
jgi:hypothetical protein